MVDYAASWNKWFPLIERAAGDLSCCMLDAAGVAPGHRVLDLATGIGDPALMAAERVGADGRVLGIDSSAQMIALARARAGAAGVINAEFQVMDIDSLTLPPATFDATLCRWGLMFAEDLAGTLDQARAALRPGGRLSVSVWATPDDAPAISLAARVAHHALGLPPPEEGEKTAFALCDIPALVAALEKTKFDAVNVQKVPVIFEFASPEEYVAYRREISTPLAAVIAKQSETRQTAAWQTVARAVEAYRSSAGTIRMENQAYCLSAARP